METFLLYIGKAALAAGAFYLLYLALFQHQKQFTFNRIYLPVSLALSFLIPLITFTSIRYIEATPMVSYKGYSYLAESSVPIEEPVFQWQWFHYLIAIYILGSVSFLLYLVLGHLRAISIIRKSRLQKLFNVKVNVTFRDVHPFSFFNKIVLSEKTLKNPALGMIVQHEEIHVRGKHTLDILFAEIIFLFQWFNPFAWLLKDAIKNNLEYLTDHQLTLTNDAQQYQLAMLGLVDKRGVAPFLTALNGSQLKNRIIMMKKKTENKSALLKQLVVLPLLAILVMGLSNKEVKTEIVPAKAETEIVPAKTNINVLVDGVKISLDDPVFKDIDFSKGIDGREIMLALGIEDKVILNGYTDESDPDMYYIQTRDYVRGTNPEFDKLVSPSKEELSAVSTTTLHAVDGKILNEAEVKKLDGMKFESFVILSGNEAVEKYGDQAKDATVIDYKTGSPNMKVSSGSSVKEITVSGKITDLNGNPISGVAVLIDGTTVGTISDRQGNYELTIEKGTETLIFVMVDYKKQEIEVNGRTEINVQLVGDGPSDLAEKLDEPVVFEVDQSPEFPGGDVALRNYIAHSLVYPQIAMENGIQGKVYVTFVVNKVGKVVNPKIARGVDPSLDKEALRIVSSLPLWKPGKKDGKEVNVSYTVPVKFEPTDEQIRDFKKVGWGGKTIIKYDFTVRGKVTNENGDPISGAAIIIKDKPVGTITDSKGNYEIGMNDKNEVLIFSMVGFKKQEIAVDGKKEIDIQLRQDDQSKSGEIQIRPVDMEKLNKSNPTVSSSGVSIRNNTGQINEPLYVVDGNIVANIDYINPEYIESVSVLKDESATKLYGEKGKNGVILVTTKKAAASSVDMKELSKENPLYVVDGKEMADIKSLNPEDIAYVDVLKNEVAGTLYGEKGKNGIVRVTTKAKVEESKFKGEPLIYLDGEEIDKEQMENLNKDEIVSMSVLKNESAIQNYGADAKNGVVAIQTKDYKITTEMELRRYIAQHIKYPVKAADNGEQGVVQVFMEFGKENKTVSIHNYAQSNIVYLDDVVVVAYANPDKPLADASEIEFPYLAEEVNRIVDKLPPVEIPAFKGKAIGISVKFVLQ